MSVNIKTNIVQVEKQIQDKLGALTNETILRPVMFGLIDLMTQRIHIDGKASDGGPIGSYSFGYWRYERKKNKRQEPQSKVVISLTRQLENDWSVEPTQKGYGIGFKNKHNYDKSQWTQQTYGKRIFDMTQGEYQYAIDYIGDLVKETLSE